jgi:hypothetical protein
MRFKPMLQQPADREPVGIVIADGGHGDGAPTRFSAFVWGPVPDEFETVEPRETRKELVAAHA